MKKMKSFQSLSATLVLIAALTACSNDTATKEAGGNADTAAATVTTGNADDGNQQKLEANKNIVREFTQALYGDKDSTAVDKYVADNVKQHNPLLQDGKQWLKNGLRPFLENPNIQKSKIDIKQIVAEGDKVWVLIREVAPNGKIFARSELFRIENGKIAENWLVTQAEPKASANKNGIF